MPIVTVRRDAGGRPGCSLVFLLERTPAPHERISTLVLSATLTVDLRCTLENLTSVTFRIADQPAVVADGPFGTVGMAASFQGPKASELLTAVAGAAEGPTLTVEARRGDGLTREWRMPLMEVLRDGLDDVAAHVRLTTDMVSDVPPVVRGRTRGPAATGGPLLIRDGALRPVASIVRPEPAAHLIAAAPVLIHEALLAVPLAPAPTGPILGPGPLLTDRDGSSRWYLPECTLLVPPQGQDAETSPARFDLVTAGHQEDGSPGLEATVTFTVAVGPSAATTGAWEAEGRPAMRPLPCSPTVGLRIPFRGPDGSAASEVIPATTVTVDGTLGEVGSRIVASFVVKDRWARLAYGVLSSPGYQQVPPTLEVGLAHQGWRQSPRLQFDPALIAGRKLLALRRAGDTSRAIAPTQVLGMAKARIQVRPPLLAAEAVCVGEWRQVSASAVQTVPCVLPCADHGQLYRQLGASGWEAIGCQEALRLGQTDLRVWRQEPVATPGVAVWKSLTQPGRYLAIPSVFAVGRRPATDPERPLKPALLLTSTIDVDDPSGIRCVLAAALQADLTPAERAMVSAELQTRAGREIEVLSPWQAGLTPDISWAIPGADDLDCVQVDDGFTLVLSTDIPGLLTLRSILQRGGFLGSARYRLPGGDVALATLKLDLAQVVGPEEGPVLTERVGDEVRLTNLLDARVCVRALTCAGVVVASPALILAAGGSASIALPASAVGPLAVDHQVEAGTETLDESRAYIDDLDLAVTFVATGDVTSVAGIEISCSFLGETHPPVTLTRSTRQAERRFVLPLTRYADDPTLRFTATAVAVDGTRTAASSVDWPVRSRGVLIPIDTPSSTTN